MKKIKETILNDFGLKIFSLVSAAVLWLLVTSFNDPITTMQVMEGSRFLYQNRSRPRSLWSLQESTDLILCAEHGRINVKFIEALLFLSLHKSNSFPNPPTYNIINRSVTDLTHIHIKRGL